MSEQRVLLAIDDNGIAEVTLNRSDKLNALDMSMFKAIEQTITRIKKDKRIRAVIVRGEGEDFCSGLDVKSVMKSPKNAISLLFKWWPGSANLAQKVTANWRKLSVPVIMVIHGRCWGGGMQIALGGDFRITHPDASLSVMESHWGLIPDMAGNKVLSQNLPLDQGMKLAMTAEKLGGNQALELGLVTEVSDKPLKRAREFAQALSQTSPDVLAAIKKLYVNNWHKTESSMLAKESWYQVRILSGKNQRIASQKAMGKDKDFVHRKTW